MPVTLTGGILRSSIALLAVACTSSAAVASDSDADGSDVRAISDRMYEAMEAGDLDVIERFVSPAWKLYITLPTMQTQYDRDRWLTSMARMNESGTRVLFDTESAEWGVGAGMAWYRAEESVRWVGENEDEPVATARWLSTHVWAKEDGQWVVVHSHHSYVSEE